MIRYKNSQKIIMKCIPYRLIFCYNEKYDFSLVASPMRPLRRSLPPMTASLSREN